MKKTLRAIKKHHPDCEIIFHNIPPLSDDEDNALAASVREARLISFEEVSSIFIKYR